MTTREPLLFGATSSSIAMSFSADTVVTSAPASPASTIPDYLSDRSLSDASDDDGDDEDDNAMDMEIDAVHGQMTKLDLSDTPMDDSDSDSNFSADTSDSESLSGSEASEGPLPPEPDVPVSATNPHIPPHFTTPAYEHWLAAQTPNVLFQVKCKPVVAGSMIAAHSIRLWYRDFRGRDAFLQRIVDEYKLLGIHDICGFIIKERRSKTWLEFGRDMESWNKVLTRIRNRVADENLTGLAVAVRAELRVLVGGDHASREGKLIEKGPVVFMVDDEDPDL